MPVNVVAQRSVITNVDAAELAVVPQARTNVRSCVELGDRVKDQ